MSAAAARDVYSRPGPGKWGPGGERRLLRLSSNVLADRPMFTVCFIPKSLATPNSYLCLPICWPVMFTLNSGPCWVPHLSGLHISPILPCSLCSTFPRWPTHDMTYMCTSPKIVLGNRIQSILMFCHSSVKSPRTLNYWIRNHCPGGIRGLGSCKPLHNIFINRSMFNVILYRFLFRDTLVTVYYWWVNTEFIADSSATHAWTKFI